MGPDWPLKPSGIARGGQFRLIVVTSGTRNATSTNIDDYNTHVKNSVRGGHSAIRAYSDSFRALGSTAAVDARDNTGTRNTGVPIYWLNGNKVADDYPDFYDGSWDDENPRNQSGNAVGVPLDVWTGSGNNGTEFSAIINGVLRSSALGSTDSRGVAKGRLGSGRMSDSPMSGRLDSSPGGSRPLYGLSPIFKVRENPEITGFSGISAPLSASAGYATNETIIVRVAFSETVVVTETPYIVLNIGGRARRAVYTSGSGTSDLDFAYTVQAADFDSDGVNVCASAVFDPGCRQIQLDGGTIVATSDGLAPALTLPELDDQSGHKVDGTPVTIDPGLGPISRPGVPAMGIVPADWALRPSGLNAGDKFRLLFVTSDKRDATSTDIADYNSFVQSAAAAGHAAIRGYSAGFRALASTESVDARDNTATTGTGVPIYWLNSSILADDYSDLYDGSWANESLRTNERGTTTSSSVVWSGSTDDGRESTAIGCSGASTALGAAGCNGDGGLGPGVINPSFNGNPLVGVALSVKSSTLSLYGISQVLVWQVIRAKASSARIVSRPASGGTYAVGETVAVELGFGEDILVRGTPQLELELDSGKVVARYASGSGTGTLRFEYVVRIGDHTAIIEASLDEDGETALRLGGATITDARGEAVDPGTPALANNAPNQRVEARPPGRDRGVDGVLAGERGHLRDRRDRHGAPRDARGRDGGAARAPACLAGGRRRGAPGRVFRAGGERDAGPRILLCRAGGRPRHRRRAAVLERPSGHRLRADPPERRHHPRVAGRPRRRARHAEAGRAVRAQGGCNGNTHRAVNGVRGGDQGTAPTGRWCRRESRSTASSGCCSSPRRHAARQAGRSGRTTSSCRDGRMPDTAPSGHTARVSA